MMARDEVEYFAAIRAKGRGIFADLVAERIGLDAGRAEDLIMKWTRLGWWAYGVSLRSGWLTDEAPEALAETA